MILELLVPNSRQEGLTDSACRSPIRFTEASASSRAVFNIREQTSTDCKGGLFGGLFGALNTVGTVVPCPDGNRAGQVEPPRPLQDTNN